VFSCKRCLEKDKRIEDLKQDITFLRSMLSPNFSNALNLEANKILEGAGLPIIEMSEPSEPKTKENVSLQREAISILTGNYYEASNS
jgi:hypothetical protein